MFCKSCGNQIDNDSNFCSFCGTRQSDVHKTIPNGMTLGQTETQTENANLSFERLTSASSNVEVNKRILPKYDLTYYKERYAAYFGAVLLVISLVLVFVGPIKFDNEDSYNQFKIIFSIAALFIRIVVIVWVVNITKRQNRKKIGWGLLAFFLPSIALIIVGQLNKLYKESNASAQSETPNIGRSNTERQEFSYRIFSEIESSNFTLGRHTIIRVAFSDGRTAKIYKGKNSGKYFYFDPTFGKIYFASKEDAILSFHENSKNNS